MIITREPDVVELHLLVYQRATTKVTVGFLVELAPNSSAARFYDWEFGSNQIRMVLALEI